MEATVPRHKYPICDPLGSPTIHLSVSLYREGWNTFDLCEKCQFLSNINNTGEGSRCCCMGSTHGVKKIFARAVCTWHVQVFFVVCGLDLRKCKFAMMPQVIFLLVRIWLCCMLKAYINYSTCNRSIINLCWI